MDWIQSISLGDLAAEFFQKLSAAVNLLATPKETLLQVRGHPFVLFLFVLRWACVAFESHVSESCLRQPECFHCLKGVCTTLVMHVCVLGIRLFITGKSEPHLTLQTVEM